MSSKSGNADSGAALDLRVHCHTSSARCRGVRSRMTVDPLRPARVGYHHLLSSTTAILSTRHLRHIHDLHPPSPLIFSASIERWHCISSVDPYRIVSRFARLHFSSWKQSKGSFGKFGGVSGGARPILVLLGLYISLNRGVWSW